MEKYIHNDHHGKNATPLPLKIAIVAVAVLAVAAIALVVVVMLSGKDKPDASDAPNATTTIATTTTTAAPPTTTTTTVTTTAATTSAATNQQTQPTLLQYDTAGHYVQPAGGDWNLLLVNDWNGMPAGYEGGVSFVDVGNNQRLDSRIVADFNAMLEAGKAYGIGPQSGYRSAELQGTLYWRKVNQYGGDQEKAGQVVKRPGYSEHNTGLAIDLGGSGNFLLEQSFENTPAFKWLIAHCADYGFILRFPKGKEAITGVIYEPWHYRYVGKEAAQTIMAEGLCLEEYLEEQKK